MESLDHESIKWFREQVEYYKKQRELIEKGINLPWAYYDLGRFLMVMEKPYEAFNAYAKAVQLSTDSCFIETSLQILGKNVDFLNSFIGFKWVYRLLLLGIVSKSPSKISILNFDANFKICSQSITSPVLVIAGGCDNNAEIQIKAYEHFLKYAFPDYQGTVVSGGTTAGVSGLAGTLQEYYPGKLKTIGYAPSSINDAEIDKRYSEICFTGGIIYSPLEPLQYWADILRRGIKPSGVRVLGINGGMLAGAEFRMALAFGAKVGLIAGSGREADKLLMDEEWNDSDYLFRIPRDDKVAFKSFLSQP